MSSIFLRERQRDRETDKEILMGSRKKKEIKKYLLFLAVTPVFESRVRRSEFDEEKPLVQLES